MCGIAGEVRIRAGGRAEPRVVEAMCAAMRHRGPDGEGAFAENEIALGMRRLAILDREGGDQPFFSEDRSIVAVYNGEIYNHAALRAELGGAGCRFVSRVDGEVIPHAYERWGEGFVERLNGVFAIALFDRRARELHLWRDPAGVRPLYFAVRGDRALFASEVRALARGLGETLALDEEALQAYLALRFVPAPRTLFRGVEKLPPGGHLRCVEGRVERERYAVPARLVRLDGGGRGGVGEAAARARSVLAEAVDRQLMADVPLGLFLSGGLDSSAIAAFAAPSRPRTFTARVSTSPGDEAEAAALLSARLGLDHEEVFLDARSLEDLPRVVETVEEPVADPAALGLHALTQVAAASGVRVVLSGDGGDEVFGGYRRYFWSRFASALARLPRALRPAPANLSPLRRLRLLPPGLRELARRTEKFLRGIDLGARERYFAWLSVFDGAERGVLLGPPGPRPPDPGGFGTRGGLAEPVPDLDDVTTMQLLDLEGFLPEALLVKEDKIGMAFSLETRVPFLDREVVAFALGLPASVRVPPGRPKALLRRALRGVLPEDVLARPKRGFDLPIERWFAERAGSAFAADVLRSRGSRERGLFDGREVERLLQALPLGDRKIAQQVYSLLALELWCRRFLDSGPDPDPSREEKERPALVSEKRA